MVAAGMILLVAAISFFCTTIQKNGEYVTITANGEVSVYPLADDRKIVLGDGKKGKNVIVIENHMVYMEEADCPDQICVRHKPVEKNGESIICLPNRVFVEVQSHMEKETDN